MVKIYIDPEIAALRELHSDLSGRGYLNLKIGELMALQAKTILDGHKAGNSAVTFHLGSWSPDFVGKDSAQIMSCSLTLEQAQETIAREHGYGSWNEIEFLKNTMLDEDFERAVDAVVVGDITQIQRLIQARPELVIQRSQYGHRAT